MKRTGGDESGKDPKRTFEYRGRIIEIIPGARRSVLRIDGEAVEYEQSAEGVYSDTMAYMRFGSPEELAEALVRDWGTAKIERRHGEER